MTSAERAALVLQQVGLHTNAIGPLQEWSPAPAGVAQRRHDDFWQLVTHLLPEDEDDERFWMTHDAARELEAN